VATAPADEADMSGRLAGERFREVVLPHLPDALSLARWLTGNVHDAEDVVQEACLKAHAGIGTYAGGNARAWL
jgi:RNA polymerase sigma-70 factor (ECF subfamily)